MPATLEAITHEVLDLPNHQRLALARIILDLDGGPADADAEAAWDLEIRARLMAYDEGRLETVSWESFTEALSTTGAGESADFPEKQCADGLLD